MGIAELRHVRALRIAQWLGMYLARVLFYLNQCYTEWFCFTLTSVYGVLLFYLNRCFTECRGVSLDNNFSQGLVWELLAAFSRSQVHWGGRRVADDPAERSLSGPQMDPVTQGKRRHNLVYSCLWTSGDCNHIVGEVLSISKTYSFWREFTKRGVYWLITSNWVI